MSETLVDRLNEDPDGARTTFTTADPFVSGSFRLVLNGSIVLTDDPVWGYSETDSTTVELLFAPDADETLAGQYQVLRSTGSPFDPNGVIP